MIMSFDSWLAINEASEHKFGCFMLFFNLPQMKEIQSKIRPEDLLEGLDSLEDEPHVTLLYGLHDDGLDVESTIDSLMRFKYPSIRLDRVSAFFSKDRDVLKFIAQGDNLVNANAFLMKLPNSNEYPTYRPHCTIAYLKSGRGQHYIDLFSGVSFTVRPKELVYSRPSGEKIKRSLL